ncbi:Ig-like domain-containing protein [Enterobacter kobei]|nr:Ig-like domain-containing protein [Enterobacter kobei]
MILGFGNNVKGAIAADISANQTSIPVMPGTGALFASTLVPDAGLANSSLPAKIFAKVTLTDEQETIFEICHLTAVAGDTLTVIRGQEGTTPRTWYIGDHIANFATRGSENLFVQVEDLQSGKYTACVAGGTGNALTADIPTAFFENGGTAITLRTPLYIIPTATNTGPATILVMMSGQVIGTFPLVKGGNEPLKAGDIVSRLPALIVYNTQQSSFQVVNPAKGVLDVEEGEKFFLQIDENLGEIADNGPGAQKEARDNLDLDSNYLRIDNNLSEIADNGSAAQKTSRENLDVVDGTLTKKGLVRLTDLSNPADEDSLELALTPAGLKKITDVISPLTVPVGGGMLWFTSIPPDGWLEGNGQAFDPVENPKLLAVYPSGHVPDMRGYFLRGWDHGAGVDPDAGRGIGSVQQDAMQNITGSFPADTREAGNSGTYTTGAFRESRLSKGSGEDGSNRGRLFTFDASRVVRTSTETRGKNIATMIIFKTDKASAEPGETTPTAIVVTPQGAAINAGSQLQFTATVLPSSVAGDYPVSWDVSDSSLGSIDSTGLYMAIPDRSGNQVVIASVRTGLTVTTPLTQYIAATSITISPVPEITVGETYHAVITMLPPTANEPLIYTSANNDIATFSGGVVSGQGEGVSIITATGQYSGVAGSQTVAVIAAAPDEEYLQVSNNLSEIAANGPEAQSQARQNIGLVGYTLVAVKEHSSSVRYVPSPETDMIIFEVVAAGGSAPGNAAPEGTQLLITSAGGAGAYMKTMTTDIGVGTERYFDVEIGALTSSGNGGAASIYREGAGYFAKVSGGMAANKARPANSTSPYNLIGSAGGVCDTELAQGVVILAAVDGESGGVSIGAPPGTTGTTSLLGDGGSSPLGNGGHAGSAAKPGFGGGCPARKYDSTSDDVGILNPAGASKVIVWEYALCATQ